MKAGQRLLFLAALAAACAAAGTIPAAADEVGKKISIAAEKSVQTSDIFEGLPDQEELFEGYVNGLFFGSSQISAYGNFAEEKLEGVDLKAYQFLKAEIQKIASGERSSTIMELSPEDLGIVETEWRASDLGTEIVTNGQISNDAMAAWQNKYAPNVSSILHHLLGDCPMDFYWFNKTTSGAMTSSGFRFTASNVSGEWVLKIAGDMTYSFMVSEEYADRASEDPFHTVDVSIARTAKESANRAKEIVKKYEGYSDHDKLSEYRKEICSLVSYNTEAAENDNTPYGNPWQLIWVFDGDDGTNVVCEGYAKAFQYLCDMSDFFSPEIRCYSVSGMMGGGTGAGPHMWNVVTMDDGKNYIVDVTNCDEGTVGAEDKLFLSGASGSVADGYEVALGAQSIRYEYSMQNPNMSDMYGDILKIHTSNYEFPYVHSAKFGANLQWTLDANGFLNIKGSGDMPEPENQTDYEDIPWYPYRNDIRRVVIEEGITSVASWAFLQIGNITEIYLPNGLKKIENASFALSGVKKLNLPDTLESIGMLAFANCTDLQELTIPDHVAGIGAGAFMGCESLETLTVGPGNARYEFADGILYGKGKTSVELCLVQKSGSVILPDSVTEIGVYAFNGCKSMTEIEIPAGVTRIGTEAFKACDSLTDVWFLGDCPEFGTGAGAESSVFFGDALTIHYLRDNEASWRQVAASGFEGAEIKFEVSCGEDDHVWETEYTVEKEATCTEDGSKAIRCVHCGKIKERIVIPAGHDWEDAYTTDREATCTEEGAESIHCKKCDETKDGRSIPLAAHRLEKVGAGPSEHYQCLICKKEFQDAEGKMEYKPQTTPGVSGGDHEKKEENENPPKKEILVANITITSNASNKIAAGKKVSLSANVAPLNAANTGVIWKSDNEKYASVRENGVVTTKKAGKGKTVTITAEAADGSGVKASFKIKLMQNAVTKVKFANVQKTLKAGKSMKLKTIVSKNGKKANTKLRFVSSNPKVAVVDSKGKVKAKSGAKGKTVTITAYSTDGTNKKAKVKIKIG